MDEIFRNISTYGLAIVISGLVIWFAIKFGNIWVEDFQNKRNVRKHDDFISLRNRVGSVIQSLIERTVLRIHADRVYVFEFHNGSVNMGGLPFLKMTNSYEALSSYATSEIHRRQNMPVQLFQSLVDAVYAKKHFVMDIEKRTAEFSPLVYEILEERKVRIAIFAAITDLNNKLIGYLGIDFCRGNPIREETVETHVETVLGVAAELGALLSVESRERKNGN